MYNCTSGAEVDTLRCIFFLSGIYIHFFYVAVAVVVVVVGGGGGGVVQIFPNFLRFIYLRNVGLSVPIARGRPSRRAIESCHGPSSIYNSPLPPLKKKYDADNDNK